MLCTRRGSIDYFLRRSRSFSVFSKMLKNFYRSAPVSRPAMTLGSSVYLEAFGSVTDRRSLNILETRHTCSFLHYRAHSPSDLFNLVAIKNHSCITTLQNSVLHNLSLIMFSISFIFHFFITVLHAVFHCLTFYSLWCFPVVVFKNVSVVCYTVFLFIPSAAEVISLSGSITPSKGFFLGCTNGLTTFTPHISNKFAKIKQTKKIDRRHHNLLFKTAMKLLHKSKPFILITFALKSTSNISCQWTVLEVFLQKCTHAVVRISFSSFIVH